MQTLPPQENGTGDEEQQEWLPKGINWYHKEKTGALACMDCLDLMREMPDKSVDLCLCDPPYGIGANKMTLGNRKGEPIYRGEEDWDKFSISQEYFNEIKRISKNQIIWGGNYFASKLFDTRCWLVWDKHTGDNDYADCELAWTSFDSVVKKFDFSWVGANAKEKRELRYHPTQKPLELMRWCLEKYSQSADVVFDPFLGSGTTARACKDLGRKWIGCEIEQKYCDIAVKRLAQEVMDFN